MTWLTRLFSTCLFGHGNLLYARNKKGQLVWTCERCARSLQPILPKQKLKVKPQTVAQPKFWRHRKVG